MSLPLILITGQAGSGKDTIASFLVKNHKAVAIAQADPMKRFVKKTFAFSDEQLWGPSEMRNAVDTNIVEHHNEEVALAKIKLFAYEYVVEVLPGLSETERWQAAEKLQQWGTWIIRMAEAEGGISPRKVLQTLGTEWGRNFSRDMWVDYAKNVALKLLGGDYTYSPSLGLIPTKGASFDWVVITDGRFRNEVVSVLALGGQTWRITAPGVDGSEAEKAGVIGHASETEQRSIPDHFFTVRFVNDKARGLAQAEADVTGILKSVSRPVAGNHW